MYRRIKKKNDYGFGSVATKKNEGFFCFVSQRLASLSCKENEDFFKPLGINLIKLSGPKEDIGIYF